jgi:lysine-specific demethylase 8
VDPAHSGRLYPHGGVMGNTSRVDVEVGEAGTGEAHDSGAPARATTEFPLYAGTPHVDVVLGPGDVLFIPRGWWHHVRALSASFSVSFWWD